MVTREFSLEPHRLVHGTGSIRITGRLDRRPDRISMHLQVLGALDRIVIPAPSLTPSRKDRLWEGTCFELFLALENSPKYWEVNLSPAGDWNVYRFSGYRENMEEEESFISLPFACRGAGDTLQLTAEIETDDTIGRNPLQAGVSAVLAHRDSGPTYWALTHLRPKPDFHARESFTIRLPCGSG